MPATEVLPSFRLLSDAVLAAASELSVPAILSRLAEAARAVAGARYAAIGVPDGDGGFAQFVTSGMSDSLVEAIGPLPRTHGLLDAMLRDRHAYRIDDVGADPRFQGWPEHHPRMRSFVGVPMVLAGDIVGAFYVTDKLDGDEFVDADVDALGVLAAHAAIALRNAQLYERVRELTVIEERHRLARDLHDSVSQLLFSALYIAETATVLLERDPSKAREHVVALRDLNREALDQMRALVFELRRADLAADGLVATLRKHVDVLRRIHPVDIELDVDGERRLPEHVETSIFRIATEAIGNALRHAGARTIRVEVELGEHGTALAVHDDGSGFDPDDVALRARRLGLTSMAERAASLGGRLDVESAPGRGTSVRLEVLT